jgi:uroporphyrinogen decarboxylase
LPVRPDCRQLWWKAAAARFLPSAWPIPSVFFAASSSGWWKPRRVSLPQIDQALEALQIFDSWAGNLAEASFGAGRWALSQGSGAAQRQASRCPGDLFRAARALYAEFARIPGVAGLSLDNNLPLAWAAAQLQPHVALQGNLDPILLAVGGEAMRREIRRILETLGRGPLVFNLGHGIVPETPPEHVSELVEMVRGWRG